MSKSKSDEDPKTLAALFPHGEGPDLEVGQGGEVVLQQRRPDTQKPSNPLVHTLSPQVWIGQACPGPGSRLHWRRRTARMRVGAKTLESRNTGHVQTEAKKDEVLQRVRGAASNGSTKQSRENHQDL